MSEAYTYTLNYMSDVNIKKFNLQKRKLKRGPPYRDLRIQELAFLEIDLRITLRLFLTPFAFFASLEYWRKSDPNDAKSPKQQGVMSGEHMGRVSRYKEGSLE